MNSNKFIITDLLELIIDHRGKTPKKLGFDDFNDEGIPVLSAKHVKTEGLVNLDQMRFANSDMYQKWMPVEVCREDIILTSEAPLGEIFYIDNGQKYVLGQRVFGLRCKKNLLDPKYFFAWLASSIGQHELNKRATGSTVQGIKQSELRKIEISLPHIKVQQKIGKIRNYLDRKIENNNQINQTLEATAQAIFKSWFVDFDPVHAKAKAKLAGLSDEEINLAAMRVISSKTDVELEEMAKQSPTEYKNLQATASYFPDEFEESELGMIPMGWKISTVGEEYNITMGQSPKGESYNEEQEGILFFQGRAEFGWRYPTPRLYTTDPKRMAYKGDVLMSVRAPVGDFNIALEDCCIGRGLAALKHKSGSQTYSFYHLLSLQYELDRYNGEGTVFGSINQANLKNIFVISPNKILIDMFIKNVSVLDKRIENNAEETLSLINLRDTLLPRLLSGELAING